MKFKFAQSKSYKKKAIIVCLFLIAHTLKCDISFSNKSSQIKLGDTSKLIVSSAIIDWNGTLVQGANSELQGESISFSNGVREDSSEPETFMKGSFTRVEDDATYKTDCIYLNGSKELDANGPVNEKIIVSGQNNKITGDARFQQGIVTFDEFTTLYLGLRGPVDQTIDLANSKIYLEDNLLLEKNVLITGTGTLNCNNYSINLSGSWGSQLTFVDVHPIWFDSAVTLSNVWTFQGDNVINAGSTVLDITNTFARIVIDAGATLVINDALLHGMETGKFVFGDDDSTLQISGGQIFLTRDVLMSNGNVVVDGTTTILTGSWGWIFTDQAQIDADDSALWIDSLNLTEDAAVFGEVGGSGVFSTLINTNSIRQVTDLSQVKSAVEQFLLSGALTGTVYLEKSFFMHPSNQLRFIGDTLLTASGASLIFSSVEDPQLVVLPYVIAAFQSIKLLKLNNNTFNIQPHGSVSFDPNVEVEFTEDMNITTGVYRLTGTDNVCSFRGSGGQRKLIFSETSGEQEPLFAVRDGVLALEDINLSGLEYFTWENRLVDGEVITGAIALKGRSILTLDRDLDMNLIVEGRDNEIHLTENDLRVRGNITFGDLADNSLTIRFALQEDVDQLRLYLDGNAILLSSDVGRAGLRFEDFDVTVVNESGSSLIAGAHSYLGGNRLTVEKNPIRQLSRDFELETNLDLKSDLPNPVDDTALRSPFDFKPDPGFTTAFHRSPKRQNKRSLIPPKKPDNYFASAESRAIRIPNPSLRIKKRMKSSEIRGTIRIEQEGVLTDFSTDTDLPLYLELSGGARVYTRVRRTRFSRRPTRFHEDVDESLVETLKYEDKVYVSGTDNKVIVTGHLQVKGEIIMDEDAELVFEFDDSLDTDKSVYFGHEVDGDVFNIEMPKSSSLIFQGSGEVKFEGGSTITCQGTELDQVEVAAGSSYEDDRPSIIFKSFAKLLVEEGDSIIIQGRGNLIFQDYAQAKITGGALQIGTASDDFFDIKADRNASIKVGVASSTSSDSFTAKMSLATGLFNLTFDRASNLAIRQGGLFEISLLSGQFQEGQILNFLFDGSSQLTVDNGGCLAFGQEKVAESIFGYTVPWDNIDSAITGDGYVALITQATSITSPAIEGKIQQRYFTNTSGDAFSVVKKLIVVSPTELDDAVDFVDRSGNYKVITSQNQIVDMDIDDDVTRQDTTTGYVYGWKSDGREFRIFPNGTKQHREV
ncbi:hypothetical protein ACFLY6_03205 [Candidatus Dependentiae bacterium]